MKRNLLTLGVLFACTALGAQNGVFAVRQASDPDGRILTMEEVITDRNIYPRAIPFRWKEDGGYLAGEDALKTYRNGPERQELPDGAENVVRFGGKTAYTVGGSLFLQTSDGTVTVAESEADGIVYGQSVSRNEFGINEGVYWSPAGNRLAFYRKDESLVTKFPLLDIGTRTGSLLEIRYPMNGMVSEKIALGIYDTRSGSTVYVQADDFGEDRYLTNVSWSPDEKYVFIQVLDRSQHHMRLNQYRACDGSFVRTLLTEDNEAWVEPEDHLYFIKGRTDLFLYRTDNRDGYKNLYLCDTLGTVRRLTPADADVAYLGNDGKSVFYTSAEVSPVENHLFRIDIRIPGERKASGAGGVRIGKPVRLTSESGWHSVSLNGDCSLFCDIYANVDTPYRTIVKKTSDGSVVEDLHAAENPLAGYAACEVDLGTVKSADGHFDNYYRLIKPRGFDPAKKYPVIVYVYGGPHSQLVRNTWLADASMWEMYMAQKGYIVYVQDNRGTSNRGAAFEKAINGLCGQAEMADQVKGIEMLCGLPYVDSDRIGVHGWSYGGFMTISLLVNYPEIFKVGVAGGPVIDWKWYEIMYGERYMDTDATNHEGFAATSLLNKAADLKGKLLICQGAVDKTVVWEHSLSFVQECIRNNVQVDYFPYPIAEHNVFGRDRIHLMDKVTMYFEDYL